MEVPISDAQGQLSDLVRRAQAGDEVVLTRHGQPTARIVPVEQKVDRVRRRHAIERIRAAARERGPDGGPSAARSADFLYDENGLPA